MKKLILSAIIVLAIGTGAFAQSSSYKAFKVDLGFLYGLPVGSDYYSGGVGFYLEPKYNISDNIALGLRLEWAILAAADALGENASISALSSYLLTGDYYLGSSSVRPYVGAGIGLYGTEVYEVVNSEFRAEKANKFGFAPRVGLLLGHFRTGLEYNLVTGTEGQANYLALKIGAEIGGGRK